jgi:hypothetical protein
MMKIARAYCRIGSLRIPSIAAAIGGIEAIPPFVTAAVFSVVAAGFLGSS